MADAAVPRIHPSGWREVDRDKVGRTPDEQILYEAKERFQRAQEWEGEFRRLFIEDVKFANGDSDNNWQWPDSVLDDRDINDRPSLTVNKTRTILNKLVNEAKQNPPEPRIKPVGGKVSFEAAQVWEGIVRHIMYVSNGQAVIGQAKEAQLEGGIGYWLVTHDFIDDRSFDQELLIRPLDPLHVYMDCDIKQVDGNDAMWAFVFEEYNRKEFERLYPRVTLPPPSSPGLSDKDDWVRRDGVRIAEYYRINIKEDELLYIEDENGAQWTGLRSEVPAGTVWRELLTDYEEGRQRGDFKSRKVRNRQLEWYKIAGPEIIEQRTDLKGRYVPIVREPGRERRIEDKLYRAGLTRALKDPQRMYNYNDLHIETPLPTPVGWTTMGEVKPGDVVLSDQGLPTTVLAQSPIFINRRCFSVKFDDGSEIVAGGEHLWTVEERGKRKAQTWDWSTKTITTNDLVPKKHFIWVTKPLDLQEEVLPVDPYILGAWLGDGYSAAASICSGLDDMDAMEEVLRACRHPVGERKIYKNACSASWTIGGLKSGLRELGVLGNKHIPACYLRASRDQREALLQGLMDTDGHFSKHSRQNVFVTVSFRLAEGFTELVRSLGLKATYTKVAATMRKFPDGHVSACQESFRFSFSSPPGRRMFRLPRKATAHDKARAYHPRRTERHRIVSITEVPSVPTKCITVDAPSKLYLAGPGMIPTHNTSGEVEVVALQTKTPWVVAAAAIEGNETAWNNANKQNAAYLTYRHKDEDAGDIPPPTRPAAPAPAEGFLEGMRIAAAELEMASGMAQAQQVNPALERTPKAIDERMRTGEAVNYDFTINEMYAVRHTAVIILDLAPHIYNTERVIKIRAKDGTISEINIDPHADEAWKKQPTEEERTIKVLFNPSIGKYAIEADVGPAYQTQRQAAWDAFVQIITHSPELIAQIGDLGFLAADFPMAQEIAERLRRNIEQTMPWLLKDSQIGPIVQNLQQELQKSQQQTAELLEKLAAARIKMRGRDELRDIESFNADTRRMAEEIKAMKELMLTPQQRAQMEHEITMRGHEHVYSTIEAANEAGVEGGSPQSEGTGGSGGGTSNGSAAPAARKPKFKPEHIGAKKAPDGRHYLPDPSRKGKYLLVA